MSSSQRGSSQGVDRAVADRAAAGRAFIDLHCHTSASFDSLASPQSVVRAAASRGLTHLAITDHDRIDGALRARDAAPVGLTVIVGEEVQTLDGDLIAVFIEKVLPAGLSAVDTIAAIREQGGLVGVPHPFDRSRGYGRRSGADLADIADMVDWVEAYNARVVPFRDDPNHQAAMFALEHHLPALAASDSHTVMEVGVAYSAVQGDPRTPQGLLAALSTDIEMFPHRATFYVRAWTPLAKLIQSRRGNGRRRPGPNGGEAT
jgi:predicted metal-dependent phosphoesterase TrpH